MEQRRTRRFKLYLPVAITRSGAQRTTIAGHTHNISSNGVLFTTDSNLDPNGGPIEYLIDLNREGANTVRLRCVGKVVRFERSENAVTPEAYQVAATLERYEFIRER